MGWPYCLTFMRKCRQRVQNGEAYGLSTVDPTVKSPMLVKSVDKNCKVASCMRKDAEVLEKSRPKKHVTFNLATKNKGFFSENYEQQPPSNNLRKSDYSQKHVEKKKENVYIEPGKLTAEDYGLRAIIIKNLRGVDHQDYKIPKSVQQLMLKQISNVNEQFLLTLIHIIQLEQFKRNEKVWSVAEMFEWQIPFDQNMVCQMRELLVMAENNVPLAMKMKEQVEKEIGLHDIGGLKKTVAKRRTKPLSEKKTVSDEAFMNKKEEQPADLDPIDCSN